MLTAISPIDGRYAAKTKALQSSPVNMEGEEEEEEFAFDPTTGEGLLDENENNEVDDSGMEAGLESDSDEEPTQETAQPGNDLVVLDLSLIHI